MRTIAVICLLVLILSPAMTMKVKKPSLATVKRIEALTKNTSSWSSIILNMAALQLKTEGPLDELISAIQKIVADLDVKLETAHADYDRKSVEHGAEVRRFQSAITDAQNDIANSESYLNDVLYVMRATLLEDIANLKRTIENTRTYIAEATAERERQHEDYETLIIEHNEALAAIQEALAILNTLIEGDVSLVQVKKVKTTMQKVQGKLHKSADAALIKALVALATNTDFANQDALKNVQNLLIQVSNNLEESLRTSEAAEVAAQEAHVADIANKENEINSATRLVTDKSAELETTERRIVESQDFIVTRKGDLAQYENDLVNENTNFDTTTRNYEALVVQFQSESAACSEALSILETAEFAGYLGDRMGADVIYNQPHGEGIKVEAN